MANLSSAFLIGSSYETFAVSAAEALTCGCPVISTEIPAISEYMDAQNSIIIKSKDVAAWETALAQIIQYPDKFIRTTIAAEAAALFNEKVVGEKYYTYIKEYISSYR